MKVFFKAPAKINLCLHVLGRRVDGYHELAMAMQAVSLCDDVHISLTSRPGVRVVCDGLKLAEGEENIAALAATKLLRYAGRDVGVDIGIVKRIPVAAGLGGGSSDAAAVLTGLSDLLGLGLANEELRKIGAELGADVPFFIYGRPAWATGTGTCLEGLLPLPPVAYLLVNPGFEVSTAAVYQRLQLTKGGRLANLPRFSVATREDLCLALHNDLEPVTSALYPEVIDVKQALLDQGASGALMSGSGATVFGVFPDLTAAQSAGKCLESQTDWFVCPVEPLV